MEVEGEEDTLVASGREKERMLSPILARPLCLHIAWGNIETPPPRTRKAKCGESSCSPLATHLQDMDFSFEEGDLGKKSDIE